MEEREPKFFSSYIDAKTAYDKYKAIDPFPEIPPALLNSADIMDYVRTTGMIYPFYDEDLSGATYSVRLKGLCIYYTEKEQGNAFEKHIFCIGQDHEGMPNAAKNKRYEVQNELRLAPNSITFITLEPVFQVPDYLIMRFNLKISHIYKGLLLGTGPIVDPGFRGRLSIPLHNLTASEYVFQEDDEIITLEITKMSPYETDPRLIPKTALGVRMGEYKPTKIDAHRQVSDYLRKAGGTQNGGAIVSSVIGATNEAKRIAISAEVAAKEAQKVASEMQEKTDKQSQRTMLISLVAIFVTIVTAFFMLVLPSYQLIEAVTETQLEYTETIKALENKLNELGISTDDLDEGAGGGAAR